MKTIFKYSFHFDQTIKLPEGAKPLMVSTQNNLPMLWVECHDDVPMKHYLLFVVPTGGEVPDADYVGTFFNSPFVWHLYIDKKLAEDRSICA